MVFLAIVAFGLVVTAAVIWRRWRFLVAVGGVAAAAALVLGGVGFAMCPSADCQGDSTLDAITLGFYALVITAIELGLAGIAMRLWRSRHPADSAPGSPAKRTKSRTAS
jgi:hypothetical protein